MFKNGEVIEVEIEKIVFGGEGLGHYDDKVVFVPMSVPGDVLKVEIISSKKSYSRGIIKEIIKPSVDRIDDGRITYEDFFGCDFMMINYKKQLEFKKIMVAEVLDNIGKFDKYELEDVMPSEDEVHYRNKIIQPVEKKNGEIITGFYKKKSHDIVDDEKNYLMSKTASEVLKKLKEILNKFGISIYDEETKNGLLRHIMIRTNQKNEAMLVLIINGNRNKLIDRIVLNITKECPEIKSVYLSINKKDTNVALGTKNMRIYGELTIKEYINDIEFNISPESFFQINIKQAANLYNTAISYFSNIDNKIIVDAFSGTGTIGMIISKKAKLVYGIEMIDSAVKDALNTARNNNIKNIRFISGKVEDKLVKMIEEKKVIDGIIFDPPRKGIQRKVLEKVAEANIKEIVYISCNPSTFARDAAVLKEYGYTLEKVKPVDMFPQTNHIEIVAKITKK